MQVIFIDQVPGVATKGEVKNVRKGFYRNYLLPQKKAVIATEILLSEWEKRRKREMIAKEEMVAQAKEIGKRLSGITLKIPKKVTKKKTLYGAVKVEDIVKSLKNLVHIDIPPSAVSLPDHLKTLGTFEVSVHLAPGVDAKIPLEIVEKES